MEKIYRLFFLLAIFFSSLASPAQPPKFGYTNSAALLAGLPEVKQADKEMESLQTQLQKRGLEILKSFQDASSALERKKEQGEISPKDYEAQAAKLKQDEENIKKYEQEGYSKLTTKREELYKPILDKVNRAMQAVAKENGYKLIFDVNTQILLYAEEYLDVTSLVKTKLGL